MLRNDAVRLIQSRLGGRFDAGTQAMAEAEMQVQQDLLEQRMFLPWFLFQEAQITVDSTAAAPEKVSLPDDFLREYGEDIDLPALWVLSDSDVWLPIPKKEVTAVYLLEGAKGLPRAYSLIGEHIRLWPTPEQDYTLRLYYYRKAVVLDSNIENDWLKFAAQLLWAQTGEALAVQFRDREAVGYFAGKAQEASAELVRVHVARQEANYNALRED